MDMFLFIKATSLPQRGVVTKKLKLVQVSLTYSLDNRPVCLAYNLYFLANEQYFSLTINQLTIFSVMAYQPSE